jgi:hypothetical protein
MPIADGTEQVIYALEEFVKIDSFDAVVPSLRRIDDAFASVNRAGDEAKVDVPPFADTYTSIVGEEMQITKTRLFSRRASGLLVQTFDIKTHATEFKFQLQAEYKDIGVAGISGDIGWRHYGDEYRLENDRDDRYKDEAMRMACVSASRAHIANVCRNFRVAISDGAPCQAEIFGPLMEKLKVQVEELEKLDIWEVKLSKLKKHANDLMATCKEIHGRISAPSKLKLEDWHFALKF